MSARYLTSHEFMRNYDKTKVYQLFKSLMTETSVNNHHRGFMNLIESHFRRQLTSKDTKCFVIVFYIDTNDKDYASIVDTTIWNRMETKFDLACKNNNVNASIKFVNSKDTGKPAAVVLRFNEIFKKETENTGV